MPNSPIAAQFPANALPRTQPAAASVETSGRSEPRPQTPQMAASPKRFAEPGTPNRNDLSTTVKSLNDLAAHLRRELRFDIDEASGRTIINVVDADTDELIRQIPPEEIVALAEHFEDFQGVFLQAQA
ncbi:MAG: flagellar protein FlaG [Gammaproteobacteria bacterium]